MEVCAECYSYFGAMARSHALEACPLRRGSYCGLCASYGHSPMNCPDSAHMSEFRVPTYLEQLVPPCLLEEYQITTRTAIPTGQPQPQQPQQPQQYMEVLETEEVLRSTLTSYGVKPMICQEKGKTNKTEITENKKRLQKIADALGRKLIFVKAGTTMVNIMEGLAAAATGSLLEEPGAPLPAGSSAVVAAAPQKTAASSKNAKTGSETQQQAPKPQTKKSGSNKKAAVALVTAAA